MIIKTNYISKYLELSEPVGRMKWSDAMGRSYPNGWRVPTRAELIALFDEATGLSHNAYRFDDLSVVWTASHFALNRARAWYVYFGSGCSDTSDRSSEHVIRLVREVKK